MTEKAQVARGGSLKRSKSLDVQFWVAVQAGMACVGQCFNNLGKTERHTAPAIVRVSKGLTKSWPFNARR